MRLIVDLPDALLKRVRELEFRERYASAQEFIWAAVENQLLLEERGALASLLASDESGGRLLSLPTTRPQPVAAQKAAEGPLWGMINRFLPLKLGSRILANLLLEKETEWVLLHDFQRRAAGVARQFGLFLRDLDAKVGRRVEERLSIGLPVGEDEKRSLARYQQHFLAASAESGLRKLGLAAVRNNLVGEQVVGSTKEGLEFARLRSPILDRGEYTASLSAEEVEFLKQQVATHVPGEHQLWKDILDIVGAEGVSQEQLRQALEEKRQWKGGTLTTMVAGAVARMKELGLIRWRGRGPGAVYQAAPGEALPS